MWIGNNLFTVKSVRVVVPYFFAMLASMLKQIQNYPTWARYCMKVSGSPIIDKNLSKVKKLVGLKRQEICASQSKIQSLHIDDITEDPTKVMIIIADTARLASDMNSGHPDFMTYPKPSQQCCRSSRTNVRPVHNVRTLCVHAPNEEWIIRLAVGIQMR